MSPSKKNAVALDSWHSVEVLWGCAIRVHEKKWIQLLKEDIMFRQCEVCMKNILKSC